LSSVKQGKKLIDSEKYEQSLSFWDMGFCYLNTSKVVFNMTVASGNKWVLMGNGPISENEYSKRTEFSDFNIIIPCLYNLYHGLELVLKGFLILKKETSLNHKIETLYSGFKLEYSNQTDVFRILDKYVLKSEMIEPLKSFVDENKITVNKFYDALRYPYDKNLTGKYEHIKLMFRDEEGIPFFKETVANISKLEPLLVSLGRELES